MSDDEQRCTEDEQTEPRLEQTSNGTESETVRNFQLLGLYPHQDDSNFKRKKNERAGHRGTVTKLIRQLTEAVDQSDLLKLKQLSKSLTDKAEKLAKLDEEILEKVSEDRVQSEIENADSVRESITLALITIEETLTRKPRVQPSPSEERSPCSSPVASELDDTTQPTTSVMDAPVSPIHSKSGLDSTHSSTSSRPSKRKVTFSSSHSDTVPQRQQHTIDSTPFMSRPLCPPVELSKSPPSTSSFNPTSVDPFTASRMHAELSTHSRPSPAHSPFTDESHPLLKDTPNFYTGLTPLPRSDLPVITPGNMFGPVGGGRYDGLHSSDSWLTTDKAASSIVPPMVSTAQFPHPGVAQTKTSFASFTPPTVSTARFPHINAAQTNTSFASFTPPTVSTARFPHTNAAQPNTSFPFITPPMVGTARFPHTIAAQTSTPTALPTINTTRFSHPHAAYCPPQPFQFGFTPQETTLSNLQAHHPTASLTVMPTTTDYPHSTVPSATEGVATTAAASHTPQVKLPKLTIRKFNGDLTKWMTFWDAFNSSIHTNSSLSEIDKFNYLRSFLESSAADAIAGLTLTSANYNEAIATLKKRFGNTQSIINKHMDSLLRVTSVSSHHDVRGLRKLYDAVETHIRGLRALGVPTESYGGLFTSVLVSKLPPEVKLVVNRTISADKWDLGQVLEILEHEVDARERTSAQDSARKAQPRIPSANALMAANSSITCTYCGQGHQSISCNKIKSVEARKELLRKDGRCYICLRKGHRSRDCRSRIHCKKCQGRHHGSICNRTDQSSDNSPQSPPSQSPSNSANPTPSNSKPTSTLCTCSYSSVLLQTAQLQVSNPNTSSTVSTRSILDCGSQRSYITQRLQEQLNLCSRGRETLRIKTFGSTKDRTTSCHIVSLAVSTNDGGSFQMTAYVVPLICDPISSQPINHAREQYDHLLNLELADSADSCDYLEVDMLIGSDVYWDLVTGRVIRGDEGPAAIETKVGWVLSGPAQPQDIATNLILTSTHTLEVSTSTSEPSLDNCLSQFWNLESLGIQSDESSVYEQFVQQIRFDGKRYEVSLPWKEHHHPLPDNLSLARRRLDGLLKRLRQSPQLMSEYNTIIQDQLRMGIIEPVTEPSKTVSDRVHYLPHHCVLRQDKTTTKVRIVFDASARTTGPSLNDCLYRGPKFDQSIFDILLRFRLNHVALIGDIEKAFLMVSVNERDRDSLRFLWTADVKSTSTELITLRFARIVFGVTSSPFLLNATINHHIQSYAESDPAFVEEFLSSIYVDDVVFGATDPEAAYNLYLKSRLRLAVAGFKLRKFVTNSDELRQCIDNNEAMIDQERTRDLDSTSPTSRASTDGGICVEDQSYAKTTLGIKSNDTSGTYTHKVLGVQWDAMSDDLQFDISEVAQTMAELEPCKRSVVCVAAKFFDPLGVVSPVTIRFKILCQNLCEAKVGWDEPLAGELLSRWNQLLAVLQGAEVITIPRCVYSTHDTTQPIKFNLVGFCDASSKAYAAVVYARIQNESHVTVEFLSAKTRVAPIGGSTIPRLELLSALLLAKLISNVHSALSIRVSLGDPVCYSDSKVALYWIYGCEQEWKQFVENRSNSIRSLIPIQHWRHCAGVENPADLPSRGTNSAALIDSPLWLHGPDWLCSQDWQSQPQNMDMAAPIPDECKSEMKLKSAVHSLITIQECSTSKVSNIIDVNAYSSTYRLYRVTSLVLRFIDRICCRTDSTMLETMKRAKLLWIKDCQSSLPQDSRFSTWKRNLGLFQDDSGVWKCSGRMQNSCLSISERTPILLDKTHQLTRLIVTEAHLLVFHDGVKETLTQLRSEYWLVRGRQFVRSVVYACIVCKRHEGKPCQSNPAPPLPEHRVARSRPFQVTGIDFAGPFFVRISDTEGTTKVWLCLYTCSSTRAVHLDLVTNMTATTFLRSFRRFSARRGTPSLVITDNAKTFKAAAKIIKEIQSDPEVIKYFMQSSIKWEFNLEKAPWWGGMFERMIKSTKRCLKKAIGKNCLLYDELATLIVEVEAVLNSRPLTYVSSEDTEEPLTPSHLLVGHRVLSLPDPKSTDSDQDYSPEELVHSFTNLSSKLEHFWNRWKKEYLIELREFHRLKVNKGSVYVVDIGDVVTVYDESHPRGLWRLGKVTDLITGVDGVVRGVYVKVVSRKGSTKVLRRPLQQIYPLELRSNPDTTPRPSLEQDADRQSSPEPNEPEKSTRPKRKSAALARDKILGCTLED